MPYCRLYYHIIWTTIDREPMLCGEIEQEVYEAIRQKAKSLGAETFEINGIEDHIHLAASIPPIISVSRFVGEVKGASSHHVNHLPNSTRELNWHRGYGATSFRKSDLEQVLDYIKRQKEHHASGKTWPSLETCDEPDERSTGVRESSAVYDPFDVS